MPTDVRCLVETDLPYPVLRLVGDLDAAAAGTVRSALLNALLDQPAALIVDVSQVRLVDPATLAVLTDVGGQAAEWAGARLLLCAPPDELAGSWAGTGLEVCPSREAAFAAVGEPRARRLLSVRLDPVVGAARRARELVTEVTARWELSGLVGPACIVVTELVNNVVAHVRGAMTVGLAVRNGGLTITVRDASTTLPRFSGPVPPTSYGGRGLLLIDSVARRWGAVPLDDGKIVWAVLDPPDDAPGTTPPANGRTADPEQHPGRGGS